MKPRFLVSAALAVLSAIAPATAQEAEIFRLMDEAVTATPETEIARADVDRARAVGKQLTAGPYEFELAASGGHRRVEDPLLPDMGFNEWSLDLSRTVRLPEKRRIDSTLAGVELEIAEAQRDAMHVAERLEFVTRWNDWYHWTALSDTSLQLAESAQRLARFEQDKADAGSGRQIEADLLAAEARGAQLAAEDDRLRAEAARARLLQRYPGITLPDAPPQLEIAGPQLNEIMSAPLAAVTVTRPAALEAERARLQLRRKKADRLPDPTFGVGLRNDFGGDETAVVATFSIPLGGQARRSRADEATAQARIAAANQRRVLWRLEQTGADARLRLDRAERLLAGAQATLELTVSALDRLEAGYALGEIRIDNLMTVRRRVVEAARIVAEQGALRQAAYLELLVLSDQVPVTNDLSQP